MKRTRKTEEQLLKELQEQTKLRGGISRFAEKHGFSVAYVSTTEKGLTPITDRVAKALGYRRIVEYERAK